ncbi:hypothetical protein LCGC14_1779980 [marine sediment metagenome]|uniref:Nucleotide-diphospho-sugar transferase domain-containing protein n=1 Tax=marine sediment metagenome TaxID=412755 RepID=A0A0F9GVU3_9ZZZZ
MKYHLVAFCSHNYQHAMESSMPSWLASDAETINVYMDGWDTQAYTGVTTYPIFQPCNDRGVNCVRKSEALLRFCADNTDKRHVVMLDVDCYILGNLMDAFCVYGQFDVAVTVYKNLKQKHRLKNVSAGALFIRNTPQTRRFLRQWIMDQQSDCYQTPCRDQKCLSLLLHRNPLELNIKQLDYNIWNAHANPTVLKTDNNPMGWLENLDEHCRVLHLARGLWKNKELVERFVYG